MEHESPQSEEPNSLATCPLDQVIPFWQGTLVVSLQLFVAQVNIGRYETFAAAVAALSGRSLSYFSFW